MKLIYKILCWLYNHDKLTGYQVCNICKVIANIERCIDILKGYKE